MADIPSPGSYTKLNDVEIDTEAPVTTSLFEKFGGNVNKLIDDIGSVQTDVSTINNLTAISNESSTSFVLDSGSTYFHDLGTVNNANGRPIVIWFSSLSFSLGVLSPILSLSRGATFGTSVTILNNISFIDAGLNQFKSNGFISGTLPGYIGLSVNPSAFLDEPSPFLYIDYDGVTSGSKNYYFVSSGGGNGSITCSGAFFMEL